MVRVIPEAEEKKEAEQEQSSNVACVSFDIETGPLPDEQLRPLYVEQTYEEFAACCDQRWKKETKQAKFESARATGWEKFVEKAALSAMTGQVVAIGWAMNYDDDDLNTHEIFGQADKVTEADIIAKFWRSVGECMKRNIPMVGHNIHSFDLPFLTQRSWVLGVPIPNGVSYVSGRRYWNPLFIDTMREWCVGDSRGYVKLDTLAKVFGCQGKTDGECCGANFHKFWFSGDAAEHQQAIDYLTRDIALPASIAMLMGVV